MNSEEPLDKDVIHIEEKVEGQNVYKKEDKSSSLLNDTSIYFKGLFGMLLCFTPGSIIGLAIVTKALDQSKVAVKTYNANPGTYKESSFLRVKRGRVFGYIGVSMFILEIAAFIILVN